MRLLIGGLVLFVLNYQLLIATRLRLLLLTLILIGAFTVPIAFVSFVYRQEHLSPAELPIRMVVLCFVAGGLIGTVSASVLEFETRQRLGVLPMLGVGFIEESVKLIVPLTIFALGRYRASAAGLVFGVAAGMGFAALETTGYGLAALVRSRGDVAAVDDLLLLRALLSPSGHAAWTGLVAGTLWRSRAGAVNPTTKLAVFGSYLTVIILHALWDGDASAIGHVAIGAASLMLLFDQIRKTAPATPLQRGRSA
jgi:RsiW-degrading membrane proteinase PrsW (M82 family)